MLLHAKPPAIGANLALLALCIGFTGGPVSAQSATNLEKIPGITPRNIVLILVDDHRFDAMGIAGHPFLETPQIDSFAKRGVRFMNSYVTTSLCSPSRATILTGMYAHNHGVVDNNNPMTPGTRTFPQYLQGAGYETAFIGKWHMGGGSDEPRPGWDHWISFRGQGEYFPGRDGLNINGVKVPQKGYITDELTDYAVEWLEGRSGSKPFMLYLSHKAVHSLFLPAERHKGRYDDVPITPPPTQADTPDNDRLKPMWVKNQRNSWHGVDFPYHSDLDVNEYYRRYCETLLAVDESVGRVMQVLREKNWAESTLVIYMGDNGFCFGEHGLIDKRHAYAASIRIPMLAHCPELFGEGAKVEAVVANLDIAPTILEAAGLQPPEKMDGRSMLALAAGRETDWRETLLYEYYWERNFPHTPTMHALRTDRYKYIRYHGIWDINELYDIQADPHERNNLIIDPYYQETVNRLNNELFDLLEETGGMGMLLKRDEWRPANLRREEGSTQAEFPSFLMRKESEQE